MPWDEPRGGTAYVPPPIANAGGGGGSRSTAGRITAPMPNTSAPTYKPPKYYVPPVAPMAAMQGNIDQNAGGGDSGYYGVYRGGGGGGGGAPAIPPDIFAGLNLPTMYTDPFVRTFGRFPEYYTPARGGEDQAQKDYYNLVNFWESRTGRQPTPDEIGKLMANFPSWRNIAGRTPQFGDLMDYASTTMRKGPTPPQLSYLYMGEM